MTIPLSLICQSCRAYGVKLIDNLCEPCYTFSIPRRGLQPGKLPKEMIDPYSDFITPDKRTTLGGLDRIRYERNMR